ncbi:MAG TPA: GDSL-type esterase/lipase family protein [Beijerinckiaceae bacterium]|nr:GDSL-type esterase/lipase family protein [Beijerinckiaceae bacterium]
MRARREWLVNLGVSAAAVLGFLLLCELVVFRFVWLASDVPRNDFRNEIVRNAPNQRGIWRVHDEIAAPFAINAQGWNSGIGDYALPRRPGVERIAFVGDSFVEALQVPFDASLAEHAARLRPGPAEAYRFAISGAPMSQYLHMIEREVLDYRPDAIVVLLIHNDFDESFAFKQGRYTSSFRKLEVAGDRVVAEIPPEPWRPGALEWLRHTATVRFFRNRWLVRPQLLVDLFLPQARAEPPIPLETEIAAATDHVLGRIAALARNAGVKLLVAIDGDRTAIYSGQERSPTLVLNRIAREAAARHRVAFLDLHPVFAEHWRTHRRRFEFAVDMHWNELGHAVAGEAVARALSTLEAPEKD